MDPTEQSDIAETTTGTVSMSRLETLCIVTINRPEARNAIAGPTAQALAQAFRLFDADDSLFVAVLTGAGDTFCSGADLKSIEERTRSLLMAA